MNKVLRLNQIFNLVLKIIISDISDHLKQIFNDSLSINYYSVYFKKSIIIILYKLKNIRDFISLKNYQPICLLNTIKKNHRNGTSSLY